MRWLKDLTRSYPIYSASQRHIVLAPRVGVC